MAHRHIDFLLYLFPAKTEAARMSYLALEAYEGVSVLQGT